MKFLFTAILLISISAQGQDDYRTTDEGTTLNYLVKDGNNPYQLKAVIKQWDWNIIKFQWNTTGSKKVKGIVVMNFGAIGESNSIQLKPKGGLVKLKDDVCSLVLPYDVFDSLLNMRVATHVNIDGKKTILNPVSTKDNYLLRYNKAEHTVFYGEADNGMKGAKAIKLSFIEYMNDIILVEKYNNGNFSMILQSITAPVK